MKSTLRIRILPFLVFALCCDGVTAQFRGDPRTDATSTLSALPRVLVSGAHAYSLYLSRVGIQWESFVSASHDGGRTWSQTLLRTGNSGWESFDANERFVVVGWVDKPNGGHLQAADRFYVDVSTDGGSTWQRSELTTPNLQTVPNPTTVRIAGSHIYAFFDEQQNNSSFITHYLQVSPDRGKTWLPTPIVLTAGVDPERTLVPTPGEIHTLDVARASGCCGYEMITWRGSLDGGKTWTTSPRIDVGVPGHTIGQPRILLHSGQVSVAWVELYGSSLPTGSEAWHSFSTDRGKTWSPPTRLSHALPIGAGAVEYLDLAGTGTDLLASYVQSYIANSAPNDVFARSSPDGGRTWSAPFRLNPTPGNPLRAGAEPHVMLAGSRGLAVWVDYTTANGSLLARFTQDAGTTWSAPIPVSSTAGYAVLPKFGNSIFLTHQDRDGAATILWAESRNAVLGYHAATVHQPDLLVNGAIAPGTSFSFTVRNLDTADAGGAALVVFSATGAGDVTGGIPLFDGRVLDLDFDAVTSFGLGAATAFASGKITGSLATTPKLTLPSGIPLPPLWGAALVLASSGASFGSLTDPVRLR